MPCSPSLRLALQAVPREVSFSRAVQVGETSRGPEFEDVWVVVEFLVHAYANEVVGHSCVGMECMHAQESMGIVGVSGSTATFVRTGTDVRLDLMEIVEDGLWTTMPP